MGLLDHRQNFSSICAKLMAMCVQAHACIHACIHACMHVYMHTYKHTYIQPYIQPYIQSYIQPYIHARTHTRTHTHTHTHTHRNTVFYTALYCFRCTSCLAVLWMRSSMPTNSSYCPDCPVKACSTSCVHTTLRPPTSGQFTCLDIGLVHTQLLFNFAEEKHF